MEDEVEVKETEESRCCPDLPVRADMALVFSPHFSVGGGQTAVVIEET